jgi:hypothetical protein
MRIGKQEVAVWLHWVTRAAPCCIYEIGACFISPTTGNELFSKLELSSISIVLAVSHTLPNATGLAIALLKWPSFSARRSSDYTFGETMNAEIILKYEEKERLLATASRKSAARSVLNSARPKSNHPQLVTIPCDEQAAAAILELAQRHSGSTCRVMKSQMKRLGLLKSILQAR